MQGEVLWWRVKAIGGDCSVCRASQRAFVIGILMVGCKGLWDFIMVLCIGKCLSSALIPSHSVVSTKRYRISALTVCPNLEFAKQDPIKAAIPQRITLHAQPPVTNSSTTTSLVRFLSMNRSSSSTIFSPPPSFRNAPSHASNAASSANPSSVTTSKSICGPAAAVRMSVPGDPRRIYRRL